MLRMTIPSAEVETLLAALRRAPGQRLLCAFGANDLSEHDLRGLLFHEVVASWRGGPPVRLQPGMHAVLLGLTERLDDRARSAFLSALEASHAGAGLLFVAAGRELRLYYAFRKDVPAVEPVLLSLPGPRMEQMLLLPLREEAPGGGGKDRQTLPQQRRLDGEQQTGEEEWREKFSRLAGALGEGNLEEGYRLLKRARRLRIVLGGCGGAGWWLVLLLCQMGVGAEGGFYIVDRDTVELSNLSRMAVPPRCIGMPKAQVVALTAQALGLETVPVPVVAGIESDEGVSVTRACDVAVTAVDNDAGRFGVGVVARRYDVVHIDVSGGAAWTADRKVVLGGELRVSLPGTPGCLCCMGSYDFGEVARILSDTREQAAQRRAATDWLAQRPGSDMSVLLPVIGEAVQALFNILKGRVSESFWLHYEKLPSGIPSWRDWSNPRRWRRCPYCKQQGLGDLPR